VLHLRVAEKTRNMHGQSIYLAGANEFECEVDEGDLVDETIGYLIVDSTLKGALRSAAESGISFLSLLILTLIGLL